MRGKRQRATRCLRLYCGGIAALVLAGLALATGTSPLEPRPAGLRTATVPAFAHFSAVRGDPSAAVKTRSRQVASSARCLRTASGFPLRMAVENEDEDRLLWSRRLNRAFLTLGKKPEEWGVLEGTSECEDRLLLSRRLARAVKVLLTDPDLVPVKLLWTRAGEQQDKLISSARMLEEQDDCSLPTQAEAEATVAQECAPRPNLPTLTAEDLDALRKGERVQRQTRTGRVGTGMVVVDVDADVSTVFAVLTDIDKYPERIPTVRAALTYYRAAKLLKTQFQISKFRLQINTELRCKREANILEFKIDPERPVPFLEDARGFWYLEAVAPEIDTSRESARQATSALTAPSRDDTTSSPRTRIWLVADLACSNLLPTAIVDYAAERALPRATAWLQPVMKQMAGQLPEIPLKSFKHGHAESTELADGLVEELQQPAAFTSSIRRS